ncbi:hypothetical protein PFFCH_05326 [Plasmodium falciparum FCH/4]|uniref:Erythrocyte membrane protein 1 n=1 Tax=Plasmodium falciparum FCH/4 TaxID=1036724 RepID=A0A024VFD0_PLAFA|nr:hypothetical protein PFFCH_05326 [Plasmodium falciparum FCH/4]
MRKTKDGNGWEKKDDKCNIKLYEPIDGATPTPIKILKSGENQKEIENKLNEFCDEKKNDTPNSNGNSVASGSAGHGDEKKSDKDSLYEEWKCYKHNEVHKVKNGEEEDDEEVVDDVKNAGGLCILENKNKKEKKTVNDPDQFQKTFHDFFYYWVAHMLKDSIYWKKKLQRCLQNGTKTRCNKKNKCNSDCECFKRWVEQKKEEWNPIKEQFRKQEGIVLEQGFIKFTHDGVLQQILEDEFLKDESTDDSEEKSENNLDAEELKHLKEIKKLLDDEEAAGGSGTGDPNGKKTLMDKLIEHEERIVNECKKCQETQKPQQEVTRLRSENFEQPTPSRNDVHDDPTEDDEEPDDEDEDEGEPEEPETEPEEEAEEVKTEQEELPEVKKDDVKVCDIVSKILTGKGKLDDACTQKYGYPQRHWGWKCISDTTTGKSGDTGSSGAICVPPRRRRLYIQKIQDWADTVGNTQAGEASLASTSPTASRAQSHPLLTAFVESAAVETFFLWHRYKKIKEKERQEELQRESGFGLMSLEVPEGAANDEKNPEEQLKKGIIPDEFKRQMFYTLADYRDICTGDEKVIEVLKASGDENIKDISDKIDKILKQSGDTPAPGKKTTRESWWDKNVESIWNGMICALTYRDSGGKEQPPTQINEVKEAFFGKDEKPNNTPKTQYQYNSVTLKEEASGAKTDPLNNPKLTQFVLRPTYFRYLEEWGETFCRERTKRLEDIKSNCLKDGEKQYSGDGEECKIEDISKKGLFDDLEGPSCAKSCRSYKKWIKGKKTQYEKQKERYKTERDQAKSDNGFYTRLQNLPDAAAFLNRLKNGPCKNNENVEGKKGEDDINFKEKDGKTFQHTNLCGTCSEFKVKCNGHVCNGGGTKVTCPGGKITTENFESWVQQLQDVVMRVSDENTNRFEVDDLKDCIKAGIFKGIRKDEWKCGKVCGLDVCGLKSNNGKNYDQIILIRALIKRWLETFFEDYNKIKHKISHCIKKGEESSCIKDCVDKWVQIKKEEWKTIRKHYVDQYDKKNNDGSSNTLKNFLEQGIFESDKKKAIKPCGDLNAFEKSCGLNGADNSKKSKKGTQQEKDLVQCLLEKLETKAKKCKEKHSGQTCSPAPPETPEDEEEEDYENENTEEAKKMMPKICKNVVDTKKENDEEEGGCEPPATIPEAPAGPAPDSESEKREERPPPPEPPEEAKPPEPVKPAPTKPQRPRRPRRTPELLDNPPFKTALISSTLMWTVGIGFAAFTYFFLKKKTKSSVGNLFQILQIPKSDYDIPTLKSSNRYIPYASDRYKGKTYIYMEGDSDEDKYAFMSDTTDVTSSESEYEELDINDIYVPRSPKYKTLIEVVLEPSGNNTTASGNNTTASGKNTPSDTQNDIQNDGIPSSKITDNEWNTLKDEFISNMLQNTQNTEPNILHDNVDNNTHPTMSRHNMDQKPFIMSIHDRNLYIGQEYSYDMSTNSGQNNVYSGIDPTSANHDSYSDKNDPISDNHHPYSGIDLINDALNGDYDIYDEILKRKENELFGTKHHTKHTNTYNVAKPARDDPITNQINLFHKWLDRHRDMCEKWDTNNKVDILNQLKEEWENHNNSGNKPSNNKTLSSDVSIQIHMDNPKPINEFTNMDTYPNNSIMDSILDEIEKYNEPYYDFYEDNKPSVDDNIYVDHNNKDLPTEIHIEMDVNNHKVVKEKYPISDMWDI